MNDVKDFLRSERIARAKKILGEFRLKATSWPIQAADPAPGAEQSGRWLARKAEEELLLLADEIEQGLHRIQQDLRYSDKGKARQLTAFANSLRKKLADIERMGVQKLTRELEHAHEEFSKAAADKPASELTAAIRGMELRNYLRSLSDVQRIDAFWTAVRTGDAEMVLCL